MKWYRLKRRIRLKPNLIDPYRSISHREARRIWRKEGRPGVFEVLEGARKKAGKTPEEWEALTGLKQKRTYHTPRAAVRRWAFACVFVLLIGAFLTFTAPGRAFAAKVYKTFTTIMENYIRISTKESSDDISTEPNVQQHAVTQDTLQSIADAFDRINQPLLYLPDSKYTLVSLTIGNNNVRGPSVSTEYSFEGMSIYIVQLWPADGQEKDIRIQLDAATLHSAYSNGLTFNGAYTARDSTYYGGTIYESSTTTVTIENVASIEDVNEVLQDLLFFEN